jgi:phosphocarrier protein
VDRFENAHNACVRVLTKEGLHARPASQIAALLSKSEARLTLVNKATSVAADGSSVLDMLMMEAGFNTEVSLSAEGPEAGKILAEVVRFFNNKFDEEES